MNAAPTPAVAAPGPAMRVAGALALAGCVIGLIVGSARSTEYETEAAISVSDPLLTAGIASAGDLAERTAALVDSPAVIDEVATAVGIGLTTGQLSAAVSAEAESPQRVVITATAESGELAVAVADAVAERTAEIARRASRRALTEAADGLRESAGKTGAEALAIIETGLAAGAGVEVVETAALPGSPSGPSSLALGLVGALFGGVVGLVLLARRLDESGQPRPRISREAAPAEPGQGRPARTGRLRRKGAGAPATIARLKRPADLADSLLEKGSGVDSGLLSGLLELPERVAGVGAHQVRCVSVFESPGKSGNGRELALAVAAAVAVRGEDALLVECHQGRSELAARLGIEPSPGIQDYLAGDAAPPDVLQSIEIPGSDVGLLACITSGDGSHDPGSFEQQAFATFLDKVTRAYRLVVLECGFPDPELSPSAAVGAGDAALVCLSATGDDDAERAADLARWTEIQPRLGVVEIRT